MGVQEEPSLQSSEKAEQVSDVDESYVIYAQRGEEVSPAEAKRVLRKIDIRLMPILFLLYLLQYLDKNGINYASVYGLQKGTNLHGDDYSWLSSIFYFGYMGQFPGAILMQKLPTGEFLSSTVLCWGVILMTTPACHNFAGMAANRFLLGFVEAAVNPGFVILMGMWYKSSEQPLRLESYYCTNGIATMFGGLIGYAIGHINSGLPKWMYVFIILSWYLVDDRPAGSTIDCEVLDRARTIYCRGPSVEEQAGCQESQVLPTSSLANGGRPQDVDLVRHGAHEHEKNDLEARGSDGGIQTRLEEVRIRIKDYKKEMKNLKGRILEVDEELGELEKLE